MATPIAITFENNYPGLNLANVAGSYTDNVAVGPTATVDKDQDIDVELKWDTSGTAPFVVHALEHLTNWEGEAVLHAVSPTAATQAVSGAPLSFLNGAASMNFKFPAGSVPKGMYKLMVRASLRDKPAIGAHYMPVNFIGESDAILVYDAI